MMMMMVMMMIGIKVDSWEQFVISFKGHIQKTFLRIREILETLGLLVFSFGLLEEERDRISPYSEH